jgi:hypothetical protein
MDTIAVLVRVEVKPWGGATEDQIVEAVKSIAERDFRDLLSADESAGFLGEIQGVRVRAGL